MSTNWRDSLYLLYCLLLRRLGGSQQLSTLPEFIGTALAVLPEYLPHFDESLLDLAKSAASTSCCAPPIISAAMRR